MDFLNFLSKRASAKSYDGSSLSPEHRDQVLSAMSFSPRASNLQHFSVKTLEKKEDLDRISSLLFNCSYLKSCSLALVFFVDLKTTAEWFRSNGVRSPFLNLIGYHYGLMDSMLALQTAALTAEQLGYSTRIVSSPLQRAKAVAKIFDCPIGITPTLALTIGKESSPRSKIRHNLDWRLFCGEGFSSQWGRWEDIYVNSGKESSDKSSLLKNEEIAAKSKNGNMSLAKILSETKYLPDEIDTFALNLQDLISKFTKI